MSSPSATPNTYPYQNEPTWSKSEKAIARTAFDAALKRELHDVMRKTKQMANQIKERKIGVELSWIKGLIRDLGTDKVIPRTERDLLRLYYTREQEKLQLKLRVFGEDEKIKAIENAIETIRQDDEFQRTESQHSLTETLLKARSELLRASTALEELCRDEAKWEEQEASARKWRQSRTWQAITPEELQPAVAAIRHKIEHYGFGGQTRAP